MSGDDCEKLIVVQELREELRRQRSSMYITHEHDEGMLHSTVLHAESAEHSKRMEDEITK